MLKKLIILGLILLAGGGVLFAYADYQYRKHMQAAAQFSPTNTYWGDMDKNIAAQQSSNPLMKVFMRSNMKLQLEEAYENKVVQNQTADLIYTISILLIIAGGGVFLIVCTDCMAKGLISGSSNVWRIVTRKSRHKKKIIDFKAMPLAQKLLEPETIELSQSALDENFQEEIEKPQDWQKKKQYLSSMKTIYNPDKIANSSSMVKSLQAQSSSLEDLIKSQFGSLEKQIAEVRQMTNSANKSDTNDSSVYDKTLTQLTRQVAAINDFASKQQDKVKKLQEGYDWNIIKNFTLRIIRCIDNLETSIAKLKEENKDTSVLEEARDDFIFALESSGVEQFRPKPNSEYRGQEKSVEAITEKQVTPEQILKGKISRVLRPGYRFIIDDETSKVVRTAQVKIYG
jgi:molecular chaperone GrpE (heat shock protein)